MRRLILNMAAATGFLLAPAALAQSTIELEAASGTVSEPFIVTNGCICQLLPSEAGKGGR